MEIKELVEQSFALAADKGFWDLEPNIGEKLMLVVSELVEALEEHRAGNSLTELTINDRTGKPEGFSVELADAVIRIADLCGYLNIDLEAVIAAKHAYNVSRPHKHGKKF